MDFEELIAAALAVVAPRRLQGRLVGDVGAALLTADGNRYVGVCVDTACGTGFCAEASAIAAMLTAGEERIARIVAVWRDERDDRIYVIPPCGRCREFIRQMHPDNLDTEVVLGPTRWSPLRDLLPENEWPEPIT